MLLRSVRKGAALPPHEAAATVSLKKAEKVETDQPDFSDGQAQETPDAEQDKDEEAVEIVAENIVAESVQVPAARSGRRIIRARKGRPGWSSA